MFDITRYEQLDVKRTRNWNRHVITTIKRVTNKRVKNVKNVIRESDTARSKYNEISQRRHYETVRKTIRNIARHRLFDANATQETRTRERQSIVFNIQFITQRSLRRPTTYELLNLTRTLSRFFFSEREINDGTSHHVPA